MQSSARHLLVLCLGAVAALHLACSSSEAPPGGNVAGSSAAGQSSAGAGASAQAGASPSASAGAAAGGADSAGSSGAGAPGSAGASTSGGASSAAGGMSGGSGGSSAGGASMGGSGGLAAAVPSPGCGLATTQAPATWIEQPDLTVNGKARKWWVWLPTGYDSKRAYPIVFTFHGCGGESNYVPMQKQTGSDAIVVRGLGGDPGNGGCWEYPGTSDDPLFWDAMLDGTEKKFCSDTSRVFLTGYSSGSWFANTLDCIRGDKIRGTGTVSGGVAGNRGTCVKAEYARIFIHDATDPTNAISAGDDKELPRLVAANHCMTSTPVMEDPAPCARYQGCDPGYPVIWCETMGKGHDREDGLAPGAFWKLFSSL